MGKQIRAARAWAKEVRERVGVIFEEKQEFVQSNLDEAADRGCIQAAEQPGSCL